MRETLIEITSIFPAPAGNVWRLLGKIQTLQAVARPYAYFTPLEDCGSWHEGGVYNMKLRLFSMIPMGGHTIRVIRWDEAGYSILTHEGNRFVPLWNHEISLVPLGDVCRYTDRVTIGAGWRTPFVRLWSLAFYRHRQRKWRKILKGGGQK